MSSTIDVLRGVAYTKDQRRRKELLDAFHIAVNLCLATFGAEQREEEQLLGRLPRLSGTTGCGRGVVLLLG